MSEQLELKITLLNMVYLMVLLVSSPVNPCKEECVDSELKELLREHLAVNVNPILKILIEIN